MPYLFAQAGESVEKGWPTSTRAVALEFPGDPTSWYCDREFMVGSQMLAAPVFEEDGTGEVYLPPGRWFDYWSGEEVQGSRWVRRKYGFFETPLFVREGTVLVLGQEEGEEGFAYEWLKKGGTVRTYGVKEGDKAVLVDKNWEKKGELEVGSDGKIKGLDLLEGDWKVETVG
jgi:alpha-D-xyloside xylohydrolase